MKAFFPFTLVQPGPSGMFVANGGETHDLPDDFALSLIESGKAEAVADDPADFVPERVPENDILDTMVGIMTTPLSETALLGDLAAPVLGDDGEPLNPPAGDIAADIANPAVIDAAPKGKRGKIAATPLDAPTE